MRRFAENVIFQKFRRHQVSEHFETTTARERQDTTSGEPIEYRRHSTSRDEYSEEHYYTTPNAPAGQDVKKLHYTQSLQDAFSPPPPLAQSSKEFPPLHREMRNFGPAHGGVQQQADIASAPMSTTLPLMREEQKQEINEEEKGDNFLRRQQHKLYKLREETVRKFGHHNGPPQGGHFQQEETEQQRRARIHGSLPPLGRQKQFYQQQQQSLEPQQPFELVLDRYPPQMVQSQQSAGDGAVSTGERREIRGGSCGFSPFPVFGPFAATGPILPPSKSSSRPSLNVKWDEWPQTHHRQQQSKEENYENTRNIPIAIETTRLTTSMVMQNSSDEWQSAYEYLPSSKEKQPSPFPLQQQSQYSAAASQQMFKPGEGQQNVEAIPEANIQHTFHLYKFNSNPAVSADGNIVKYSPMSYAKGQFQAAPSMPKPWFQTRMAPQKNQQQQQEQQAAAQSSIEISTFSERQANEEVNALTRGATQSLNASMAKSQLLESGECPREVGLPDKVHYHGQPIKVEISGPVHFLHATNMNVTNTTATSGQQQKPSDSVQTSMSSSVGIPLAPESPPQGRGRQQSPTKWTQTEWNEMKMGDVVEMPMARNVPKMAKEVPMQVQGRREVPIQGPMAKEVRIQGKGRPEVISPPVERFIDSVCDIKPILAEIGQNLREQGQMISPLGNLHKIRTRHEKETRREEHLKFTEYHQMEQQQPMGAKMRTSQSDSVLRSSAAAEVDQLKKRRPSMTSSTVEALSAIWSPYLVESTSHCHLARVTEITQEWRIQQQQRVDMDKSIMGECACVIRPNYNQEFGSAHFWTMAIPSSNKSEVPPQTPASYQYQQELASSKRQQEKNEEKQSWQKGGGGGYWTDEEPMEHPKRSEQRQEQQHYGTLQTPNRRRKSQQEYQEMIYKTRSFDQEDLPRLLDYEQYENLRRTLNEVQKDLKNAQEYTRKSRNADVERIEKAILMISERIQRNYQEPVSEAQAEAKEELLRVRLAQMILNLDPDFEPKMREFGRDPEEEEGKNGRKVKEEETANKMVPGHCSDDYYGQALRAPIGLLREKLSLLERRLMDEQQLEIRDELRQISATPPFKRTDSQRRRQEALNHRNEEIARMTPLIGMLRHKLSALDELCQREGQKGAIVTNGTGRNLTPYEDRKTVHELLVRINNEIETIHELCRKEDVKDRLDTVLLVLKKVANSIDKIMEKLDNISATSISPSLSLPTPSMASKLEQAIENQQQQQKMKKRAQQLGKTEMLGGSGQPSSHLHPHHAVDIEKYSNEPRPRDPVQKEELDHFAYRPTSHSPPPPAQIHQDSQNRQQTAQSATKKVPPQVPPKRKSLTSSIDERLCPLYSIVEEKEPAQSSEQRRMPLMNNRQNNDAENIRRQILSKQRSHSQTPPPPRIVRQQHQQWEEKRNQNGIGTTTDGGPIPFRLGPCPISYLERDREQRQLEQRQRLQQNSLWGNSGGTNYLQPPSPRKSSSQQQKLFQLQQQHQIFSSLEDEEDSVSVSVASSALDTSSLSVPILFRKKSSVCSAPPGTLGTIQQETAILTEEESEREESCTETFVLRRRRKHAILNAVIYPEQRARVRAAFCGNTFEVDVERMTECGRDSVVMVSEEFYNKRVLIRSGSPVRKSTILEELDRESSEENASPSSPGYVDAHTKMAVSINAKSDYDSVHVFLEEIPWGQIGMDVKETPALSPAATTNSVRSPLLLEDQRSARSVGMASSVDSTLTPGGRENVLKQISVSEGVGGLLGDELSGRLSLRSASRRSSQKSLAHSERSGATTFLIGGQEEELEDIPAYVIKSGMTASITCELNSDCVEDGTKIEWFRGQNEPILAAEASAGSGAGGGGKFERHSQDYVEILVIYDVRPEDGQLYSVKINGDPYPVAYLIIEEEGEGEDGDGTSTPSGQTIVPSGAQNAAAAAQFLTAPQTQFVMQGETAIISVSMNRANLNVLWSKDDQMLDGERGGKTKDGRPRIWLESTTNGWYRVIVNEVQFSDQGFYYAQIGDKFTSVQLIVEDRIDEREVQVSSAETDDEELGDYLVPIGSTATIACELENVSFGYRLHWQRDHRDLDARIASGDGKFEHVVNGTKHYLIIHCAQPCDSGVYSVRIGDAKFKVAQITISNEQHQLCSGSGGGSSSRVKRISSQSLEKIEENEAAQQGKKKGAAKRREGGGGGDGRNGGGRK